jgi:uncharacterized repeat protein (TIGR01451 family)
MKKILITMVLLATVLSLVFSSSVALAAKPQNAGNKGMDVIAKSNGFPSGPHFNLNIHGKDPSTFTLPDPLPTPPLGNSIFISEYSPYWDGSKWIEETIQYESGRKSSVAELEVWDAWAQSLDGDPALVKLPYEAEGFYVFGRILGKPQNGKDDPDDRSNFILKPNDQIVDISNLVDDGEGGLEPLGLITKDEIYYAGEEAFYRFDDPTEKGKGKSQARDITHLFLYSGWVVDPSLDIAEPYGVIDDDDVPVTPPAEAYDYDLVANGGNGDGILQIDEWLAYNAALSEPLAWYFAQEWIFNIADLVITEQGLVNDGTKLFQIRFYPVATTEFIAPGYIIVDKVTNEPSGDPQEFSFALNCPDPADDVLFGLTGESLPRLLGPLDAGEYVVTETQIAGWEPPYISITTEDATDTSDPYLPTNTAATIDLDPGETVIVTFTNTKSGSDLAITKTGPAQVVAGGTMEYDVQVTNNGPLAATAVVVTDTLPLNVTVDSATVSYTISDGQLIWNIGDLGISSTAVCTITVTNSALAGDVLTNEVVVAGNEFDPVPPNNTDSTATTVVEPL